VNTEARAALEQQANGTAKRPRGNAVLPAEYAASAPFAAACRDLVNGTLHSPRDTYPFEIGDRNGDPAAACAAPSEALPPLP